LEIGFTVLCNFWLRT